MALNKDVSGRSFLKMIRALRSKRVQTYILPTSFGFAFLVTLLILFAMAIGSANNLIYLFTFFLFSNAITAMILTNRNVANVEIKTAQVQEVFAKEAGELILTLELVNSEQTSWDLDFLINRQITAKIQKIQDKIVNLSLSWTPSQRGYVSVPFVKMKSSYPFGLFGAWKVNKKLGQVLVYPERKGDSIMPLIFLGGEREAEAGLFLEHREYAIGDSPRRIDWRASARRQSLLLKKFEPGESVSFKFDWAQVEHIASFEDRISQLALWISEADRQKLDYSLSVGHFKSDLANGDAHRKLCMRQLALLKSEDVS